LPAQKERDSATEGRPGRTATADQPGPGLVVCDDHPIVRERLVDLLTRSGRFGSVSPAPDVGGLLRTVSSEAPAIAVVDLELPDSDGLSAIELVAEIDETVRTVILSAHDDPELVIEAIRRGAAGFVSKAEGSDGLLAALEVVLAGRDHFPPANGATGRIERLLSLSPREREILDLIANGDEADRIGDRLGISRATVYTHVRNSMTKLGVNTRGEAIAISVRYSYLTAPE
jgi:two-component system nitrate/nitrite response regulator NarL